MQQCTAWGSANATALFRLRCLVDRAIRLLAPPENGLSVYKSNNVMNLLGCYRYFVLIKLFNVFNGEDHNYFEDRIVGFQTEHTHATRFKLEGQLTLPLFKKTQPQHSFMYRSIQYWNDLPMDVKCVTDLSEFKRKVKTLIIDSIQL